MNASRSFPIAGELTIYRAAELCESLKTALAGLADGGDLEIDLSAVTEMDSAGAQLLMAAHESARASRHGLRLVNPSAAVDEVFETLQLAPHFADAY
jgi:anti-anti-sigma factor